MLLEQLLQQLVRAMGEIIGPQPRLIEPIAYRGGYCMSTNPFAPGLAAATPKAPPLASTDRLVLQTGVLPRSSWQNFQRHQAHPRPRR